jgi:hypothetical protein
MFGLRQAGSTATPLLPQWQNRHTGAISWGHWADFAQLDAAQLARLGDAPDAMVANRHFVLYTPAIDDLPNAGQASFRLSAAEALYSGRQGLRPAEVTNPSLQVDFDNRQFLSRFDLVVPGLEESIGIVGAGRFDDNGLMRSDERLSNSQMQGSFGPGGASAGLLFERELGDDAHVSGITHWQK